MPPAMPDLTFRTWRSKDVDALVEHANNRKIWLNLKDRFPHPYTAEDAEGWIGMNHLVIGPPVNFAIDLDGTVIGAISASPWKTSFTAPQTSGTGWPSPSGAAASPPARWSSSLATPSTT